MPATRTLTTAAFLALTAAAGLSLTACDVVVTSMNSNGRAQEEWVRSYPIAPDGRVEVVNGNGTIEVLATDGQTVEVRAMRIARAGTDEDAKALLKEVRIKEDAGPALIRLETVRPSGSGFRNRGEVRYSLKVPASISVDLRNTNGTIKVDGLEGEVKAETTNGGVRGRGLSGPIDASTTNGGVNLEIDALADKGIRAETTNGGVDLTVPENVKAEVRATCANGGITVRGLTVEGETGRRRVEGKINGGGPRITLETTNGGVRLAAGSSATK